MKLLKFTIIVGALLLICVPAIASTIPTATFLLMSDHCTGGCGAGPYGEIVVTETAANTLEFTATLFNGNTFVETGFPATIAYNLSSMPTVTYTTLPSNWFIPNLIDTNQQDAGILHQDGVGDFQYGIVWGTKGGGHGTLGPVTFVITAPGLTLSDLSPNANNQFFAVDILSASTGNTGNVDASGTPVPEPSTLLLLGLGISALGFGALRRKR